MSNPSAQTQMPSVENFLAMFVFELQNSPNRAFAIEGKTYNPI